MRRTWRTWALTTMIGLAIGLGVGLVAGWVVWPVHYYNTEISDLKPASQDAFVVMVSEAYAQNGDLAAAEESVSLLEVTNPPRYLQQVADRLTAANDSQSAGRVLQLAQALASR